jgi:hypothetical protein
VVVSDGNGFLDRDRDVQGFVVVKGGFSLEGEGVEGVVRRYVQ